MPSFSWRLAIFTQKLENIQKPRGQSLVGYAHSGLPPRFLDILSFFREYFANRLAKLDILLQDY